MTNDRPHEPKPTDNAGSDPFVRWDLSFGCTVNIATNGDGLTASVSTSDRHQATGITQRAVTREQVADYARQLLALVGEPDPVHTTPDDVAA